MGRWCASGHSCLNGLLSVTHWAGGKRMRTGDVAAMPQSLSYHMWKLSIHAETAALVRRPLSSALYHAASTRLKSTDQSLPWKAYLASRQIQDVASDLAEAIFSRSCSPVTHPLDEPSCFKAPALAEPDFGMLRRCICGSHPPRKTAHFLPMIDLPARSSRCCWLHSKKKTPHRGAAKFSLHVQRRRSGGCEVFCNGSSRALTLYN